VKLYRGMRQPNGRTDVVVSHPGGEHWLSLAHREKGKKKPQYDWGCVSVRSKLLAHDMLRDALANEEAATELLEEFGFSFIYMLTANPWAFSQVEIIRWAIAQLASRLTAQRENQRGGVLCPPSEN
jgi:hypothetical protein